MPERSFPIPVPVVRSGSPLGRSGRHLSAWEWQGVVEVNQRLCRRGRAQHGINPETHGRVAAEWEALRGKSITLLEAIEQLHRSHRADPFFFFNESTFTEVARDLVSRTFAILPALRRRETSTAVVRYVAGLLETAAMAEVVEAMWKPIRPAAGDRVRTLRGSLVGTVLGVAPDGRVHWLPDCANIRLITLPELLLRLRPARRTMEGG